VTDIASSRWINSISAATERRGNDGSTMRYNSNLAAWCPRTLVRSLLATIQKTIEYRWIHAWIPVPGDWRWSRQYPGPHQIHI